MNHDEERKLAISKMELRKDSQIVSGSLKKNIQIEKGINGLETISSTLKPVKGDASKADLSKPDKYGYSVNNGLVFCDIKALQTQTYIDEIKKIAKEEKKTEVDVRFDQCGFPKSSRDRHFILNHKFKLLNQMVVNINSQWLFLHGDVGRGKTSLAIRIAWELIKNDYSKKVTFIPVGPWIVSQMPLNYEISDSEKEKRNHLSRITGKDTREIVIMDDFDKFTTKSEYQSNILFNLIDELKNRDCRVIITSNRSILEMESDCHEKLFPVLDRIKGMGCFEKFQGKSLRS
jgi:DNA replication protein DnaC